MTKKIAIQGGFGAFHEIAAHHFFKEETIQILPRNTFRDMVTTLKERQCDFGIMAIENSLAGSIIPNYNLIINSSMHITGEIYLRIKQNLVAIPGVKITELKEVYSHPMAILQCQDFFDAHPGIRLIESLDTAMSAEEIAENGTREIGAISSRLAAEKYGLEIIASRLRTGSSFRRKRSIRHPSSLLLHTNSDHFQRSSPYFPIMRSTWQKYNQCPLWVRTGSICSL